MGTLRTILAITVVLGHSYGFALIGARNAVQMFYVISGFLISYVFIEKNAYARVMDFYINRYLRLYPVYLAVAVLTLVVYFASSLVGKEPSLFKVFQQAPSEANALLVFSNAFLFLQDWVMFTGVENGAMVFSKDFRKSEIPLWEGLVVPQAWSLGVELSFYVVAPFILRNKAWIIALLIISISARTFTILLGFGSRDPWSYRFFPSELALFLLGALAHQALLPLYKRYFDAAIDLAAQGATYLLLGLFLLYPLVPMGDFYKSNIYLGLFIVLTPLVFYFQSQRRWDRLIGELSYPIYVNHILAIWIVFGIGQKMHISDNALSILTVIVSIGFAIILNKWIADPFERVRDIFRSHSITSTSGIGATR